MERHQKNIDNLFKEALGDYTEVPPPAVWDALDKRLDGDKDKRRGFFRWYWFALMLIGISLGAAVITKTPSSLFSSLREEKKHTTIAQKASQQTAPDPTVVNRPSTTTHTNVTNKHVKKHTQKESLINNASTNKQKTVVNNLNSNKENYKPVDNKIAANNVSPGDNDPSSTATPSAENHISFKKYEEEKPAVVQTKQHNIVVTQAEAPKPINNDEQTMQQPQLKETGMADKPAIVADKKKDADADKYAATTQKPTTHTTTTIAISASKPAAKSDRKTVVKNNKTEKNNSKPIVHGTISKTEHLKKQVQDTSVAVVFKKEKLSGHTSKRATLKYFKSKKSQKLSIASNATSILPVKKVVKKAITHRAIEKAGNKTLAQKPKVKQHTNKLPEKSTTIAKTALNKTIHSGKHAPKTISQPAQNIYSSGNSNTPASETPPLAIVASKKAEPKVMTTFKTDTTAIHKTQPSDITTNNSNTNTSVLPDSSALSKVSSGRFEAGVKIGYEGGVSSSAAKKAIVSPYLQYNISSKLSIMTQPSINASRVSAQTLPGSQSFYKVNNDGKYTVDSVLVVVAPSGDTTWRRNYNYTQSHDSILKSYTSGGTYIQFELPVLAKYSISKKLSVYGGPVLDYSKLVGIQEKTYTSSPIVKTGSAFTVGTQASTPPPIDSVISYSGNPISNYKGPLYPSEQKNLFSFGYMFGVSYEFRKRWLVDALIHQSFVKPDVQGGYNINKPYSAPYFRITLGYKLIK